MFSFFKKRRDKGKFTLEINSEGVNIVEYEKNGCDIEINKVCKLDNVYNMSSVLSELKKLDLKGSTDVVVEDSKNKVGIYKVPLIGVNVEDLVEELQNTYFGEYKNSKGVLKWEVLGEVQDQDLKYIVIILMGMDKKLIGDLKNGFESIGIKVEGVYPDIFASSLMSSALGCDYPVIFDVGEYGVSIIEKEGNIPSKYTKIGSIYKKIEEIMQDVLGIGEREYIRMIIDKVGLSEDKIGDSIHILDELDIGEHEYKKAVEIVLDEIRDILKDILVEDKILVVGKDAKKHVEIIESVKDRVDVDTWNIINQRGQEIKIKNRTREVIGSNYWRTIGMALKDIVCGGF